MTEDSRLIPAGSQTVGPFFRIGLEYLIRSGSGTRSAYSRKN